MCFQPHPTQYCDQHCCLMDTSWLFLGPHVHPSTFCGLFVFLSAIIIANQHDLMLISIPASWIIPHPYSSHLVAKIHFALLFPVLMVWGSSSGRTVHFPQHEGVLWSFFLVSGGVDLVMGMWCGCLSTGQAAGGGGECVCVCVCVYVCVWEREREWLYRCNWSDCG